MVKKLRRKFVFINMPLVAVILANLRILFSHKDATICEELQWFESTQEETARMKKLTDCL